MLMNLFLENLDHKSDVQFFAHRFYYNMLSKEVTMAEIISFENLKGTQHAKHKYSNRLMWELKDFFAKHDSGYYDEKIDDGILVIYYELENGICTEIKVQVREKDFVCTTVLGVELKEVLPNKEDDILRWCNQVNCELDYGNFQLMDGEMVYKTFLMPGSGDCYEGLDMLLGYPMQMIEKYGQSFLDVCGLKRRDV